MEVTQAVPEVCESQLLLKMALLVIRPAGFRLLRVRHFLMMKANRVPACHDVEGDHAAQRVRHNGHLPVFLKVWIPWAEEWVETIQLQSQTSGNLHTHTDTQQQQHISKLGSPLLNWSWSNRFGYVWCFIVLIFHLIFNSQAAEHNSMLFRHVGLKQQGVRVQ